MASDTFNLTGAKLTISWDPPIGESETQDLHGANAELAAEYERMLNNSEAVSNFWIRAKKSETGSSLTIDTDRKDTLETLAPLVCLFMFSEKNAVHEMNITFHVDAEAWVV